MISPENIKDSFVPLVKDFITQSNGRAKDFYLYPQHTPGGIDLMYDYGHRRYPKRLREVNRNPQDRAIILNGIEVGFFLADPPLIKDCLGN